MKLKPPKGVMLNRGHPISRGLVGFWLMNEGAGTLLNDLSGSGLHATIITEPTWASGVYGPSVVGSESSYAVVIPGNAGYATPVVAYPITIACIARATTSSGQSSTFISLSDYSANDQSLGLGFTNSEGYGWRIYVYSTIFNACLSGVVDSGWHLIVGVFHSDTLRQIYVDGILKGTDTESDTFPSNTDCLTFGVLGRSNAYSSGLFEGDMALAAIWASALTASEIASLYRDPYQMFWVDM